MEGTTLTRKEKIDIRTVLLTIKEAMDQSQ